jgi:hypothetical protein
MKPPRIPAIATAVVLAGAVLAGCGSSSSDLSGLSATTLLSKATTQLAKEPYITLRGDITDSGGQTGLDLSYVGDDSHGTITLKGAELELQTVAGQTYFKPSDSFWKAQMGANAVSVIKLINGRWIIADPTNQSFGQLIQLASKDFVTKDVLDPSGTVTKGKETRINDILCIPLKTKDGTLYLDAKTARPVQIVGNGSGGTGKADFSYDLVDAPTAPAKKDTVDLSSLTK